MLDQTMYRNIIENMSAGVLLVGIDRKIKMANASIRQFLGLKDETTGRTLAEVFFESDGERYDEIMDLLLSAVHNDEARQRIPVDYELSGEKKHYLASTYSIREGKERAAVVMILEDITELSELRDAVLATQEIRRLNESLDRRDELIKKTYGEYLTDAHVDAILEGTLPERTVEKRTIVSLKNVVKEYGTGAHTNRILKGIDLDIYEHEFLVILGESGCGKSTMMNIVGGMDFMTEGTLWIEGKDFSHPTEKELTEFRRNYVGFVFQSYNLIPTLTVQENVSLIKEIAPDALDPKEIIAQVGLADHMKNFPVELSGGEQQRVSIARALAKNPKILLCDEPTGALDSETGVMVLKLLLDMARSYGKTIVIVTHNQSIARMADLIVRVKNGRIVSCEKQDAPLSADEVDW